MKHLGFLIGAWLLIIVQLLDVIFNNQSSTTPAQFIITILLVSIASMLYDISENIAELTVKKNLQEYEDRMVELTRAEGVNSKTTEKENE